MPDLQSFALAGETALALRYGHRSSIDLDLFNHEKFDLEKIAGELESVFHEKFVYKQQHATFGIFCFIDEVKVDLVRYPHRMVMEPTTEDEIRLLSIADLAAMKIQAILGRGVKKDFWDLHELLQHYPLQKLMEWHAAKFPSQMLAISIPYAITYFADADGTDDPVCFRNLTWDKVKKGIAASVREYLS